jgi:hypothetical protein
MIDEINNIRSIIKKEVFKKHGLTCGYAKDCEILSSSILEKTNRQLSHSTLKRFFGIVHSPFKPSKYTLDTIAIYLMFKNWGDLMANLKEKQIISVEPDYWERLNKRIQVVTNESLTSIKAKIGDRYNTLPVRLFAVKKVKDFLNSDKVATAFIAPGGYGKSTIMAQITERFFTAGNAKYPNDIVCLIDGSILVNIMNLNLEMVRIKNIVDFDPDNSFSVYFRKNPNEVKGRFVLIVESLYEIYTKEEKLVDFVENLFDIISAFKDLPWFKVIITCRPDDWKIFTKIIKNNPVLATLWYDVSFEREMANVVNIPMLNDNEIKHYLKENKALSAYEYLKFHHPEITGIINNPYFLNLFDLSKKPEEIHSDIELLAEYVYSKVLTEPYLEQKSKIINSFFRLSQNAKVSTSVEKKELPSMPFFQLAYKELVNNNVLYEYTVPGNYLSVNTYVKFTNDILLGFFLANKWIDEKGLRLDLIRLVYNYYENNGPLQIMILAYLIKFAFKENKVEILKNIFVALQGENEIPFHSGHQPLDPEIINVIGVELRKNKEIRDVLLPHYAKSKLGQLYYFESFFDMDCLVLHSGDSIDYYLENKKTPEALIYGRFLKFMQYFLAGDDNNCKKQYELMHRLELPIDLEPRLAGYYFGAQVIFQAIFMGDIEPGMMDRIYKKSGQLYATGMQEKTINPVFEQIIIYSLNYGDRFDEICKLMEYKLKRFEIVETSYTWRNQLSKIIYARALFNTGKIKQALELFKQVEIKAIPINYRHYVTIRFNLIRVEFLIFLGKRKEAKLLLEEIKNISQMLKLKFFYDKALSFENKI